MFVDGFSNRMVCVNGKHSWCQFHGFQNLFRLVNVVGDQEFLVTLNQN